MREPLDPSSVQQLLLGAQWVAIREGSFSIGTLRIGSGGSSGETIRNEIWFSAVLEDGDRCSGPFAAVQALRH